MFKNLDTPPDQQAPMLWVDFSELRALVHPDKCFSKGDLIGIARRGLDIGRIFDADERWKLIADMVKIRQLSFGSAYPFKVSQDQDTIELHFDESGIQTTYLGLLIASTLRNVEITQRNHIARAFEETSIVIFSNLMPDGVEVRATWAGGGAGAPYTGSKFEKFTRLANDLRCTANFSKEDMDSQDSGDGGIDMIAWHPMADLRAGTPIAFAQCGCSRDDWIYKQMEPHTAKHYRNLPVMHRWSNYYFLPLDFRRPDGDWAHKFDMADVIFVDRLRLLRLAEQYSKIDALPTMEYVAEALVQEYS